MPPVKLTWYQGVDKPALHTEKKIPQWDNGCCSSGTKACCWPIIKTQTVAEEKFAGFKAPDPFIPNSIGHWKEWH